MKKDTKEEFIDKSIKVHNYRYNYSLVEYKTNKIKVKIICKEHGVFEQRPNDHLMGQGCSECKKRKLSRLKRKSLSEFINQSNKIHNNKYDYSKSKYENIDKKVIIICKKHGEFLQTPHRHLSSQGCPKCKMSIGENKIMSYLISKNTLFEFQKTFDDCLSPNGRKMLFDFYLPEKNVCIEYDGQQHYKSIINFGGDKRFETQKKYDKIKTEFCSNNNIKLIRIPYYKIKNIDKILTNLF